MKRVLIVIAGNNGTIGRCSLNLYEAFRRREDVETKCVGIHRFDNGLEGLADCEYFSDSQSGHNVYKQIKWLKKIKKDFRPDMTISTLFSVNTLNVLTGIGEYKVGVFHSPHQQLKVFGQISYLLTLLQYLLLFPRLNQCSCVSEEVVNDLRGFFSIDKHRIKEIYNVHPISVIRENSNEKVNTAEIPDGPYFVYTGRLDANKAPIRIIKALKKSRLEVPLVIVGKGDEDFVSELKNEITHLGADSNVVFLGEKDNPCPYIKQAVALVSSSYSEGLPGVMIEAIALGVPIVSTNSSKGVWEIMSARNAYNADLDNIWETDCGFITSNRAVKDLSKDTDDINNLADALRKILLRNRGVNNDFLTKVDGHTITDIYLSLLDSRTKKLTKK